MYPGIKERELGDNPSADMLAHPLIYICPVQYCRCSFSATDQATMEGRVAAHLANRCPTITVTHFGGTMTMTILEEAWAACDAEFDKLQAFDAETDNNKFQQQRGIVTGMTRIIALFHGPFYKTSKEVAEEIRKRAGQRAAGEPYATLGLGALRHAPPPEAKKVATIDERANNVGITEDGKKGIREALKIGLMTVPQLAKMYSCSEELIRKVGELQE